MKLLALLGCVFLALQARDRPLPPTGTASVSGVVYLGANGTTPARRARVTVQSATGLATGRTTITDSDGRFEITELAADRFNVQVTREGFLSSALGASRPGQPGRPVVVEQGARVTGLTLRMFRGSAISGTVRDARGRPAQNVWVSASRITFSSRGEPQLNSTDALTDDRGQYRVWGLRPGTYIVGVVPPEDSSAEGFRQQSAAEAEAIVGGASRVGEASAVVPTSKGVVHYAPVFYPATTDISAAARLELSLEEEREGIDLSIALVPTAEVSGSVDYRGQVKPVRQTVLLQPRGDNAQLGSRGMTRERQVALDEKGQFSFRNVRPGNYRVLARSSDIEGGGGVNSQISYALADIRVDGADLQLTLQMRPAITVRGRSVFEGAGKPPETLTGLTVILVPPGTANLGAGQSGATREDGTFSLTGVIPGSYTVLFLDRGAKYGDWVRARATLNGQDADDGPATVSANESNELVLTYTDRPARLRGEVTAPPGQDASDYFIVVLPADRSLWQPGSRRIRQLRAAQDGSYDVPYLRPGEYLIAALTDLDPEDLYKRSFLETLAGSAAKVSLAEGQTLVQNLKIG
jgi:hypothetical protein